MHIEVQAVFVSTTASCALFVQCSDLETDIAFSLCRSDRWGPRIVEWLRWTKSVFTDWRSCIGNAHESLNCCFTRERETSRICDPFNLAILCVHHWPSRGSIFCKSRSGGSDDCRCDERRFEHRSWRPMHYSDAKQERLF